MLNQLRYGRSSTGELENLLNEAHYKLVNASTNIQELWEGLEQFHGIHSLTADRFMEIATHPQPTCMASILRFFFMHEYLSQATLKPLQHETLRQRADIKQLTLLIEKLFLRQLSNQHNIDYLFIHHALLSSPSLEWGNMHNLKQTHLDDIFEQCKTGELKQEHLTAIFQQEPYGRFFTQRNKSPEIKEPDDSDEEEATKSQQSGVTSGVTIEEIVESTALRLKT